MSNMQLPNPINWHIFIRRFIFQNKKHMASRSWLPSGTQVRHFRFCLTFDGREMRLIGLVDNTSLPVDICRESRSIQGLFRVHRGIVQIFTVIMINRSVVWYNATDKCYTRHIDNIRSLSRPNNHWAKHPHPTCANYVVLNSCVMHGA